MLIRPASEFWHDPHVSDFSMKIQLLILVCVFFFLADIFCIRVTKEALNYFL